MLLSLAPSWFETSSASNDRIEGRALVPDTIWSSNGLRLWIDAGRRPKVREVVPGTRLPRNCPERHILGDSTFCLSLPPLDVFDGAGAANWWWQLEQYLQCQSTATETGLWPLGHALDHGAAGAEHARALDLARKLDILDDYLAIHSGASDGFKPEIVTRVGHTRPFKNLLDADRRRRAHLAEYITAVRRLGGVCCGTMRDCPYPKATMNDRLSALGVTAISDFENPLLVGASRSALAIALSKEVSL